MPLITPARLGLASVLCVIAAAVLALSDDAYAASSPCESPAALQQRLDEFDARWNASDTWGLVGLFAAEPSLGAAGTVDRPGLYQLLLERLDRTPQPRRTRLLRATPVGEACLVDAQVSLAGRSEPALFVLTRASAGAILAMR